MNQPSLKPMHGVTESAPNEPMMLDSDHILTHAGGDPALLIQLCGTFLNDLPMRMETLDTAIHEGNKLTIERALQQLRNCLIVFGSGQVSFTAETLEGAIRGGRKRQIRCEWKRLDREVQILVPQVQRLMLEMATPRSAVQ
jgi:HPt (histidine-containing phosphotransfer) domain-containing protein